MEITSIPFPNMDITPIPFPNMDITSIPSQTSQHRDCSHPPHWEYHVLSCSPQMLFLKELFFPALSLWRPQGFPPGSQR